MLSDLVLPSPFVVFFLPCDRLTEIVHKEEDSYLNRRVLWKCILKNLYYKMMLMGLIYFPLN